MLALAWKPVDNLSWHQVQRVTRAEVRISETNKLCHVYVKAQV